MFLLLYIPSGPKVGIQYTIYYVLYTFFWSTLYETKNEQQCDGTL